MKGGEKMWEEIFIVLPIIGMLIWLVWDQIRIERAKKRGGSVEVVFKSWPLDSPKD